MRFKSAAIILGVTAFPAAATPLDDALYAAGDRLCFSRSYDAEWLKTKPGQTIQAVKLALNGGELRVALERKGAQLLIYGECQWFEGDLNESAEGGLIDDHFKATSGLGCMVLTDTTGASAEEGGWIQIEWGNGYVQAHLPEGIAAWRSVDIRRRATSHELGAADQIFRLYPAPNSVCQGLVETFALPE